jgi:hypothetical protein
VLPDQARLGVDDYVAGVDRVLPGRLEGLYAVGSVALRDFSARQSNLDLVAVAGSPWHAEELGRVVPLHRALRGPARSVCVCYVTWAELAADPAKAVAPSFRGTASQPLGEGLATPMTWEIIRSSPVAVRGPEWLVVWQDEASLRDWFGSKLGRARVPARRSLLWRRRTSAVVLETARLAQGAITGRVLSKSEAAEATRGLLSSRFQRVLTDSLGYRRGAQTSMYWGPLERRRDSLDLIRELTGAATGTGSGRAG